MSPMVVKVQIPLATSEPIPLALITNEDKSFVLQVPVGHVARRFRPGEAKAFFNLIPRLASKGAFDLGDRVPDPGW